MSEITPRRVRKKERAPATMPYIGRKSERASGTVPHMRGKRGKFQQPCPMLTGKKSFSHHATYAWKNGDTFCNHAVYKQEKGRGSRNHPHREGKREIILAKMPYMGGEKTGIGKLQCLAHKMGFNIDTFAKRSPNDCNFMISFIGCTQDPDRSTPWVPRNACGKCARLSIT